MKLRFDSRKEELLIRKEELLTAMDEFSLNLSIMIIKYFLYIFFFSAVFCELGFAEVPGFFTVGIWFSDKHNWVDLLIVRLSDEIADSLKR